MEAAIEAVNSKESINPHPLDLVSLGDGAISSHRWGLTRRLGMKQGVFQIPLGGGSVFLSKGHY